MNNAHLVADFSLLAKDKNCSPIQLALAWVLAQGNDIIPIPGTKKRRYLEENVGALDVQLSHDDLKKIDEILLKYPNIGARYSEGAMALVNH